MYSINNNILFFIAFIAVFEVQCLVELHEETRDLAITEAALRKTVNSIFSILKLDHVKHKARFGEFAAIHNFFFTITLQDDDNLKQIAILAKVDNIDNNTQHFIAQLNEVLNEDNKSYESGEDEYVTAHIETFIRKLEYLKFKYGFDNSTAKLGINLQVLNHLKSDDISQNKTKTAPEVYDDGNLLNSNEFWTPGVHRNRRIFDGQRASIKRFPFMASVQFFKKFQCGGSIIKSDLVITSASCLQLAWNNRFFRENPAFLSVQVGCELYEGCDENIPILEVYFHPDYNPKTLKNNLAIMRLVRLLKFGKKIKKIKKIDFDRNAWPLATNTLGITIIGWGAKSSSNVLSNIWKSRLAYAVLDVYPIQECKEVYSKQFVTRTNFCAGFFSKGSGACNRDAGGPGVAYGKLVGVVSFGAPNCGAPDAPTVFTKLGFYADWIEGIIDMNVPTLKRITTDQPTRETWDANNFVISTQTTFKIAPVLRPRLAMRTPVPSEDALRTLDENKLFKDFLKTMFGSEEVKEYLDQNDSDTEIEAEEKVSSKDISRSFTDKPAAETITEANIAQHSSGNLQLHLDVPKGSGEMVTTIGNIEEPVEKSEEEEDTTEQSARTRHERTTQYVTTPMILKTGVEELSDQHIAKLIDEIDIKELLESAIKKSTKPKHKHKLNSHKIKSINHVSNNVKIKPIQMKPITEKIKLTDVISGNDKLKPKEIERNRDKIEPKETQLNKDKLQPKKKTSQEEEVMVELAPKSIEESENNNDYTDGSSNNDYEFFDSDEQSQSRPEKKARELTFRRNSTDGNSNLFFNKDLLKLLHEVVAEVVKNATSQR